ncbi:Protein of unknown function [Kibdelosporangium aridum]|uniref:Uncharacterized protein n=1 Tax=Kibdelosporangium aridum TaxID=2030 RepID=A0A1W2G049_KIBAR|nr:DUF3592 domain-containing protein [Kibdelosporangium aridum]SMD27362.1 Protein of unknown function [Kibdelosporangium aridum]
MWRINVLGALFALVGIMVWLSACHRLWLVWRLRRGVRTTATVVEHVADPNESSPTPVIQFLDQRGNPRTFTPATSSWTRAHGMLPIGAKVEVSFLPKDPKQVRLLSDTVELNADKSLDGRVRRFLTYTLASPPFPGMSLERQENRLRRKFRNRGIRTIGTVVSTKPSESKHRYHAPKLRFANQQGEMVTFVDRTVQSSVNGKQYGLPAIGEHVPIVYLPESPQTAIMTGAMRTFNDLAGRFALGLVAIGSGLVVILAAPE